MHHFCANDNCVRHRLPNYIRVGMFVIVNVASTTLCIDGVAVLGCILDAALSPKGPGSRPAKKAKTVVKGAGFDFSDSSEDDDAEADEEKGEELEEKQNSAGRGGGSKKKGRGGGGAKASVGVAGKASGAENPQGASAAAATAAAAAPSEEGVAAAVVADSAEPPLAAAPKVTTTAAADLKPEAVDLSEYASAAALHELGLDRLKSALLVRDMLLTRYKKHRPCPPVHDLHSIAC